MCATSWFGAYGSGKLIDVGVTPTPLTEEQQNERYRRGCRWCDYRSSRETDHAWQTENRCPHDRPARNRRRVDWLVAYELLHSREDEPLRLLAICYRHSGRHHSDRDLHGRHGTRLPHPSTR